MSSCFRTAATFGFLVAIPAPWGALAQDASALISDLNPAIVRWASGTYLYREGQAREIRGVEKWRMTVAGDGSRTFNMWYAVAKDELSTFAIYSVDRSFNPLSLYKTTWVGDTLTQLHSVVDGLQLSTTVRFDGETVDQSMTAPGPFSITVSPVRADALHFARYDKAKGGPQASYVLGTVAAGAERTDIGRSTKTRRDSVGMKLFTPVNLEWLGEETVTVPAGRFVCDHYRIDELVDMWVHGPDYLLVSYQWHPNHYSYELVEYAFGPASD
jgi:hypothetical protein